MACAHSEDTDQPWHPSDHSVCCQHGATYRLDSSLPSNRIVKSMTILGRSSGRAESFRGAHAFFDMSCRVSREFQI